MTPEYRMSDLKRPDVRVRVSEAELEKIGEASRILKLNVLSGQKWALRLRDTVLAKGIGHIPALWNEWDRQQFVTAVNLKRCSW